METVAYFEDIKGVLLAELGRATREIVAAVAWFTDPDILELLEQKTKDKVTVRLLLIEDHINVGGRGLNFEALEDNGGEVALIKGTDTNKQAIMHNKFAVIDRKTVITGSFNWTRRAKSNYENITVITDESELAHQYVVEFNKILSRHGYSSGEDPSLDYEIIIRRVTVLKNLIQLEEGEDAWRQQVEKLQPYRNQEPSLGRILEAVEQGKYSDGIEMIDDFLSRRKAVEVWDDPELESLELELRILRIQIATIDAEKAEIERRLEEFNYRKVSILGELVSEYLHLRREKLEKEMKERAESKEVDEEADQEYEEADQEYEEFTESYEEVINEEDKPSLNEELAKKIKDQYRRASQLCHPDKVPEFLKQKAHDIFVRLNQAYRSRNIEEVDEILEQLLQENFGGEGPETITDKDKLKQEILEIRQRIERLTKEIQNLIRSDPWEIIETYDDWNDYFEEQKTRLQSDIDLMKAENPAEISS